MPRLTWDSSGERFFQVGVDRGVLYIANRPGVVWNGLTSITENSTGGEVRSFYIDGVKYAQYSAVEEFEGTLEAFTFPPEFEACDGYGTIYSGFYATGQRRTSFGLSWRTRVGNDIDGSDHAYKIHLIYNAIAEPSEHHNETLDDNIEPATFSWKIKTLPPKAITGYRRTAHFVIDSRKADPPALAAIEAALYGTEDATPALPTVTELVALFAANSSFVIVDNGDGTFTASGNEDEVYDVSGTIYGLSSAGVTFTGPPDTYTVSSP